MNDYFSMTDNIYDITARYPVLIEFLAANGFENLRNEIMRKTIGKTISLNTALRSKQLDPALFEQKMTALIKQSEPAAGRGAGSAGAGITMSGVLPCPIRLQLVEQLEQWIAQQDQTVTLHLQAAGMGLEWLRSGIAESKHEDELADIYLSAGFSLFYDRSVMGRYMDNGVFMDMTGSGKLNPCFDNPRINLRDPLGRYTITGVVPAVFMVNTQLLGSRPCPESWLDLLKPEFENSIALPMRDLDLFNAVLLGIFSTYGEAAVRQLGRGLLSDMHPAQMVKTGRSSRTGGPVVTVMPYFFTWMAGQDSRLKAVWPKDGAIISPIFLLSRASSRKKIEPLVKYLFSREMGRVFAAGGKFPSTHPDVDNHLTDDQQFMWPGWDFIHNHDISKLLTATERMFSSASGGCI